jgi:hypothetical protein
MVDSLICFAVITAHCNELNTKILSHSYRAYYYNQYISQIMHLIIYIQKQVYNAYMFRHHGAIIRELFRTKKYKANS